MKEPSRWYILAFLKEIKANEAVYLPTSYYHFSTVNLLSTFNLLSIYSQKIFKALSVLEDQELTVPVDFSEIEESFIQHSIEFRL